jgi:1-acyl-sn-glycerol-3-phosphate acyltransferase
MAKRELFWWPLGPFLRACGCFPIDRSNPGRDALVTAVDLCRSGNVVVMFPEETRRAKGLRKRHEAHAQTGRRGSRSGRVSRSCRRQSPGPIDSRGSDSSRPCTVTARGSTTWRASRGAGSQVATEERLMAAIAEARARLSQPSLPPG